MSEDVFEALEESTKDASMAGGDYADWWDPEDDEQPDELVGVIVEKHSEPEEWTDPGDVPGVINTVVAVGRGGFEAGVARTPKQHKQLINGLKDAELGDLVRLVFTGYDKVNGNMMNTYDVGVIPEEQWQELDGADDIQQVLEEYEGLTGDNTRSEPYTSAGGDGGDSEFASGGGEDLSEAAQALTDVVAVQNGSISVEKANKILNDVRGLDVDVEEVAALAGFEVDDGEISQA